MQNNLSIYNILRVLSIYHLYNQSELLFVDHYLSFPVNIINVNGVNMTSRVL